MATPEKPKRALFASAEDDLKSNSGGHYLKDCAQHLARLLSPSGRSVPVRIGVKATPVLAVRRRAHPPPIFGPAH